MTQLNVYPFNSDEVVLQKDNKAVIEDPEGALRAFIVFEKDQIDPELYGVDYINVHNFDSIWSHIDFFAPICENQEMTKAVERVHSKELNNLSRIEGITPETYVQQRTLAHEKYLQQLEVLGMTHVIYGFTYGDDGDPEAIMEKCESLEREILELN